MPFQFGLAPKGADLPVAKRERSTQYTADDLALGRASLEAVAKLGRHANYSAAREAHAILTDGQSYVEKAKASSAAARVVALLRYVVGEDWREATFHQQVGKRADGGYGWAVYMGPYEAPKSRNRTPKAEAEAPGE